MSAAAARSAATALGAARTAVARSPGLSGVEAAVIALTTQESAAKAPIGFFGGSGSALFGEVEVRLSLMATSVQRTLSFPRTRYCDGTIGHSYN
jgi:hypothetical protein